jgi:hypothetical protein
MMKVRNALLVAAVAAAFPCVGRAAPLVNYQILGSSNGTNYSSSLQVVAGQTYDFEVVGELAPVGTVNTHGTIAAEVPGQDGIGSASFTLTDAGSNAIQISFATEVLQGTYTQGTGAGPGTPTSAGGTNNQLAGARPANANGTETAVGTQDVLETGTFTVPTAPTSSTSTIVGSFGGTISGLRINDAANNILITSITESSSDPIQGIAPLTLTTSSGSSVPEPASLAVFGLGAMGLLLRRRRIG